MPALIELLNDENENVQPETKKAVENYGEQK